MKKVIVSPLRQLIIRRDVLMPAEDFVLDQLDSELRFKREKARSTAPTIEQAQEEFISRGLIKPTGWIPLEEQETMSAVWKAAMRKLKSKSGG